MESKDGTWIMYGVSEDDPECLHTVDELIGYIEEVGFLPLFRNEIPGFSVEERTTEKYWWSEDPQRDPWVWREIIARRGDIAYGKFFHNKAGFISKKWFPYFANYRRAGYDFDARWDDELAKCICVRGFRMRLLLCGLCYQKTDGKVRKLFGLYKFCSADSLFHAGFNYFHSDLYPLCPLGDSRGHFGSLYGRYAGKLKRKN
mgnify:CR=1 FL=1